MVNVANTRNAKYSYTTGNNLKHFITIRRAEMVAEKGGSNVLIRDVEEDLANFCQVTRDTILMIKRGKNQPSLAVAMKIANYFDKPVEDIFKLQ